MVYVVSVGIHFPEQTRRSFELFAGVLGSRQINMWSGYSG